MIAHFFAVFDLNFFICGHNVEPEKDRKAEKDAKRAEKDALMIAELQEMVKALEVNNNELAAKLKTEKKKSMDLEDKVAEYEENEQGAEETTIIALVVCCCLLFVVGIGF